MKLPLILASLALTLLACSGTPFSALDAAEPQADVVTPQPDAGVDAPVDVPDAAPTKDASAADAKPEADASVVDASGGEDVGNDAAAEDSAAPPDDASTSVDSAPPVDVTPCTPKPQPDVTTYQCRLYPDGCGGAYDYANPARNQSMRWTKISGHFVTCSVTAVDGRQVTGYLIGHPINGCGLGQECVPTDPSIVGSLMCCPYQAKDGA